jgi:hypothetical protein
VGRADALCRRASYRVQAASVGTGADGPSMGPEGEEVPWTSSAMLRPCADVDHAVNRAVRPMAVARRPGETPARR